MLDQIKTFRDEQGNITVSARSMAGIVAAYKDISSQFTNYIKVRINRLVLEEGKDYVITRDFINERGFKVTDYKLTLSSAIRLAKSERFTDLARELANISTLKEGFESTESASSHSVESVTAPPAEVNSNSPETRTTPDFPMLESHYKHELPVRTKSRKEQLLELLESLPEEEAPSISEQRIQALEHKVTALMGLFESAARVLFPTSFNVPTAFSGPIDSLEVSEQIDATEPLPEIHVLEGDGPEDPATERGKLHQIVNAYVASEKKSYRSVWTWLYQQLRRYYNYNVALERKSKTETYLDAADRAGQIPSLLYIAQKTLVPAKSEPAPTLV